MSQPPSDSRASAGPLVEGAPPVSLLRARVQRLLAGDRSAAAWLYDRFASPIFLRLKRRYGYLGEPEVEDLLHDTFLLVLRQDGRLLSGWLGARGEEGSREEQLERFLWDQACGLASNRRRAAAIRRSSSLEEGGELSVPPVAERAALDRDALARLLTCLKGAGSRVFLYFALRHRDGLTPDDIAQATGWSKKATYKLRQALNEALAECADKLMLAI